MQGSGFRISCDESFVPFSLAPDDMEGDSSYEGCSDNNPNKPRECDYSGLPIDVQVFGLDYTTRSRHDLDGPLAKADDKSDLYVSTVVKDKPGCQGEVHRRTCVFRQATVIYDVRLTNDSITLAPPDVVRTSGAGSFVQPDVVIADTPPELTAARRWTPIFPMYFSPIKIVLSYLTRERLQHKKYVDCKADGPPDISGQSNTTCSEATSLTGDLASDYINEVFAPNENMTYRSRPRGETAEEFCSLSWRDPMPVSRSPSHSVSLAEYLRRTLCPENLLAQTGTTPFSSPETSFSTTYLYVTASLRFRFSLSSHECVRSSASGSS